MSYRIDWEETGALISLSGTVTADELLRASVEIFKHPQFKNIRFFIIDYLAVENLTVNVRDIVFLSKSFKAVVSENPQLKVASIANQPTIRPLCRVYEWEMTGEPWQHQLFHTMDEGRSWL